MKKKPNFIIKYVFSVLALLIFFITGCLHPDFITTAPTSNFYKATNEQLAQPVVKVHAALNNLVKTYGADVVATAIAKSRITGWDNLTVAEQEERVNNAKQVVGDIINIDTVVVAGTTGVKAAGGLAALKGAAASAKEINALNLAKVAADAKKLKELEKGTTVKPAGFPPYQNKIQQKQLGAAKFGKDNSNNSKKVHNTCTSGCNGPNPNDPRWRNKQTFFDEFPNGGKVTYEYRNDNKKGFAGLDEKNFGWEIAKKGGDDITVKGFQNPSYDFTINGKDWDLKTIKENNQSNILGAIQDSVKKNQVPDLILDVRESGANRAKVRAEIDRAVGTGDINSTNNTIVIITKEGNEVWPPGRDPGFNYNTIK